MKDRRITGKKGEEMAVLFLKSIGFRIIALNWRYKNLEVDIIGYDGDVLVFVEVKVRASDSFGSAADLISKEKMGRLYRAAQAYILEVDHRRDIRFDVIAFIDNKLEYIKDAFWKY